MGVKTISISVSIVTFSNIREFSPAQIHRGFILDRASGFFYTFLWIGFGINKIDRIFRIFKHLPFIPLILFWVLRSALRSVSDVLWLQRQDLES